MSGHVITVAQQKGGSGKTTIAANLAVAMLRAGKSVALLDTDPQGSLGRWFMMRGPGSDDALTLSTASAWGVSYECDKLRDSHDFVLIDTPPKVDADLRPALRASDLVVVPVAASQVDVWATESVIDLARREDCDVRIVLNRAKAGTRVMQEVTTAIKTLGVDCFETVLGHRVAYAESFGQGKAVLEARKGPWTDEVDGLIGEIFSILKF